MLSVGIVGLPNVGKSTLFKALTKKQVDIANFPFCTIEPNVGIVEVPDNRLAQLAKVENSAQIISTAIQFHDIAGLVEGASKGEGLGNKFLASIREVDAILHVVRSFIDENIAHVDKKPNPQRDIEIIELELIFKDLETLNSHLLKVQKKAKGNDKEAQIDLELTRKLIALLEQQKPARCLQPNEKEWLPFKALNLLTAKPVIYLFNTSGEKDNLDYPDEFKPFLEIDIKLEQELSELDKTEAEELKMDMGQAKNNLDEVISVCYSILELETFFTAGEKETRAWTVQKNSTAPQAAGKIHTDFQKGFIRADIIFWEKLIEAGSWQKAREKGLVKTQGKDYVVQDGDVIIFKTQN